jgi:hypothetical protein
LISRSAAGQNDPRSAYPPKARAACVQGRRESH